VIAVKRHFGTPWHSVVVIVCKNLGTSMINLTPGDYSGSKRNRCTKWPMAGRI